MGVAREPLSLRKQLSLEAPVVCDNNCVKLLAALTPEVPGRRGDCSVELPGLVALHAGVPGLLCLILRIANPNPISSLESIVKPQQGRGFGSIC